MEQHTPNIFLQGQYWVARLDMVPLVWAHAEVIPKRYVESFYRLTPEELREMAIFSRAVQNYLTVVNMRHCYEAMQKLEPSFPLSRQMIADVLDSFPPRGWVPEGWIIAMVEGELAGQSVPHLHQHMIPITPELVKEKKLDLRHHVRRLFPDGGCVEAMLKRRG